MILYSYRCDEHGEYEVVKGEEPNCPICDKKMKRVYCVIKQINAPTGACKEG